MTMTLIAHTELTSTEANIDFLSIPGTFTDLYLVVSARTNTGGTSEPIGIRPNQSTSNLTLRLLEGNSSNAISATATYGYIGAANSSASTASTFSNIAVYIPNYRSSNAKSISSDGVQENNSSSANAAFQDLAAILWNDTTAISSIRLTPNSGGSFVSGSSATLYGILAGSDGIVAVS